MREGLDWNADVRHMCRCYPHHLWDSVTSIQPIGMKTETSGSTVWLILEVFFIFFWHCNPTRLFIFCTRSFRAFLFLTIWLEFLSICFCKSFITSSVHLFFGRPLFLTPIGFESVTFYKPYGGKFLVCLTASEGFCLSVVMALRQNCYTTFH
jgi:hypothetical protein